MSNSSSNVTCHTPPWYPSVNLALLFMDYYVLPPLYVVVSVIPSFFTAILFCRQYRKDLSYIYQRVYIVHVFLHGVGFEAFFLSRRFSGWAAIGVERWYTTNYYLMWYGARIASPLMNSLNVVSLMLLTSMAFDRFIAVTFPVHYQSIDRKRLAISLITFSYLMGFGSSVFDLPRLQLQRNDDEYRIVIDGNYTSLLAVQVFSNIRNGLEILFAFLLGIFNTTTVIMFVKRARSQTIRTGGTTQRCDNRARDSRRLERTLLILTVSQGYQLLFEQPMIVSNFLILYASPEVAACLWPVVGPLTETVSQICHAPNIIELYVFNRPFTDLLRKLPLFRCLQKQTSQSQRLLVLGTNSADSFVSTPNKSTQSTCYQKFLKRTDATKQIFRYIIRKPVVHPISDNARVERILR